MIRIVTQMGPGGPLPVSTRVTAAATRGKPLPTELADLFGARNEDFWEFDPTHTVGSLVLRLGPARRALLILCALVALVVLGILLLALVLLRG
jgi:hypothetical protein